MTLSDKRSVRVLHVVGGMVRAGAETWLMHILRNIDRDRIQMDFLVHTNQPCAFDREIRALGSQILPCLEPSQPCLYAANFKQILREYGPYDIIHSHVHHFSGYVLRLAQQAGVPVRIAHSHNDTSASEARVGWHRLLYLILMKQLIAHHATVGLAASGKAAVDLFGCDWKREERFSKLYCGVDLLPFHRQIDRVAVRSELGIPADAFVIGHVGRFVEQKNHAFLIEIAAEITKILPNTHLLLIGEGPLRSSIEQKVAELNLSDRVIFAGVQPDVPQLMLGAMDVFVLPSLHEGLPLVLMEAQAAGLPCIFSDEIAAEADIVQPLLYPVSHTRPAITWADIILDASWQTKSKITQQQALNQVEQSPFNIQASVRELEKLYLSASPKLLQKYRATKVAATQTLIA